MIKKLFLFALLPILLIGLIGITYAFFNYAQTGNANTIRVGRIAFVSRQTKTITLTNVIPISRTNISTDTTNVGTVEVEVEGDTDYNEGLEYLISTDDANIYYGGKMVPIGIDVTVTNLGTNDSSYFTNRGGNTSLYKILASKGIAGNHPIMVGYIKPNTTIGTKEGINGKIVIKAFIDNSKLMVTDTLENGAIMDPDYLNLTQNTQNKTVLTTTEWNSISSNGISFKIKVEANEGIWVDEPFYNVLTSDAVMDNIASTNVSSNAGIDFSKISGDTNNDNIIDNGEGLYIRAGTENDAYPIMYYRGNVTNNNVFFANKCWQIIRTTETGGTKLIYNGENTGTASAPACENASGTDRQITLNIGGTDKTSFEFSGTNLNNSPAYNGFTYNSSPYTITTGDYATGSKFGNSVTYNGTNYTINDISDTIDANHHYTCGTANTTTCSSIRYYFSYYSFSGYDYFNYFTLTGGKTIEDVVSESLENGQTESNAKDKIETWYAANISNTAFDAKIEDTIYCNDRSIYQLGGLNPNGGALTRGDSTEFYYSGYGRNYINFTPNLKCLRRQDSFTKENTNGNGLLDYPVGLITVDEMTLAGGKTGDTSEEIYLKTGSHYWSMSPSAFLTTGYSFNFYQYSRGRPEYTDVSFTIGLRPVISLKNGISMDDGDGSPTDPYIVK